MQSDLRLRSAAVALPPRFRLFEPAWLLGVVALVVLTFLVVVPVGWLLLTSFQDPITQELTLDNYRDAFTKPAYV